MASIHPAIQEELDMLRTRFPGKVELSLDDYANYFGITRQYAPQHFSRINRCRVKINHKRIGRRIIIPVIDFAFWLAQMKVVDGKLLILPTPEQMKEDMKRRRGFGAFNKYSYRSLG